MRITCKKCGGDHPVWDCKRHATKSGFSPSAESAKPKSDTLGKVASRTKSTAAQKVVQDHASRVGATSRMDTGIAGTQALPVDTNPSGTTRSRSSNGQSLGVAGSKPAASEPEGQSKFDKKAWQREYMRGYMQRRRAALKVKQ